MTRNGLSGRPDRLVGEAIGLMLDNQISGLPVMDEARRFVGRRGGCSQKSCRWSPDCRRQPRRR